MKRFIYAVVIVATLVGIGYAAHGLVIPDTNGLIHACVPVSGNPNNRGVLRLVNFDAGESCGPDEGLISWSQTDRPTYSRHAAFPFRVGPQTRTLDCDAGDVATGGGYRLHSAPLSTRVEESHQTLSLSGWVLTIQNDGAAEITAEIFVICKDLTL